MTDYLRWLAVLTASGRRGAVLGASSVALAAAVSWARMVLLMVAVALGGCAVLPSHVERAVSRARIDLADTTLAKIAAAATPENRREQSGFRLLPDGEEAFQARLALIHMAEKTLDVQYYLIANDRTGQEFLRALTAASARGVRVRILVDDLYEAGEDELFAGMTADANTAVRMFNPLPVRAGSLRHRVLLSLHEFARIDHRMHNKLMVADNAFAILGGRNIADEYFGRGETANFVDMDILATGPAVQTLSEVFDRYWNCEFAYPIQSLVEDRVTASPPPSIPSDAQRPSLLSTAQGDEPPPSPIELQLREHRIDLLHGGVEVLADDPEKVRDAAAGRVVARGHLDLIKSARSEILVASPYFVPDEATTEVLSGIAQRHARVSVLTNSLATTDEPLVHFGYARHRRELLSAGIVLHELRAVDTGAEGAPSKSTDHWLKSSVGRLHAKLTVVDGEQVFFGSMNMDRRSDGCNTEAGIIVRSTALARLVTLFLQTRERDESYQLHLTAEGRLVWRFARAQQDVAQLSEPEPASGVSLGLRLMARFTSDEQL